MKVVLTEKPSVAFEIGKILNATSKKDGYIHNSEYSITWAYGHLVSLALPKSYGFDNWNLEQLPILPDKFKLSLIDNPGIKNQINVIDELFNKADEIIVATDAGREGELIYRLIARYLKLNHNNISRLWVSDLTSESIIKGFKNLKPIKEFDKLYYSAMSRACADWCVGINFTQAITLTSEKNKPISVGRVQTPTLKIIVDRHMAIVNFTSKKYFVPSIFTKIKQYDILLVCDGSFDFEKDALKEVERYKDTTVSLSIKNSKVKESQPLLYDLTSLQKKSNQVYKYTAQKTLDVLQILYEKKFISYPRTDSKFLSKNQIDSVYNILIKTSKFFLISDKAFLDISKSKNFNDKQITDHHAIIPTGYLNKVDTLNKDQIRVLNLVYIRFFEAFSDPCMYSKVSILTNTKPLTYSKTFKSILSDGFRAHSDLFLFDISVKEKVTKKVDIKKFSIEDNDNLITKINDISVEERHTKSPSKFNDASILTAMENSSKYIDVTNDIIKDKGLGTPATRASIIETLIKREYVVREKNYLVPTLFGIELIKSLRNHKITSVEFTGEIEYQLREIVNGNVDLKTFMNTIKDFVSYGLVEIKKAGKSLKNVSLVSDLEKDFSYGCCPKCKDGVIKRSAKGAYCTNYKKENDSCDFFIFKKIAHKNLTENQIKDLVTKGYTKEIKGFKSKNNKVFNASIRLNENFKTNFNFNNN